MCLGVPGKIMEIVDPATNLATADFGGVRRTINLSCIVGDDRSLEACVGEWVLVHVGFAMSLIDEDEAMKTLDLLRELGEADAELQAMVQSAER